MAIQSDHFKTTNTGFTAANWITSKLTYNQISSKLSCDCQQPITLLKINHLTVYSQSDNFKAVIWLSTANQILSFRAIAQRPKKFFIGFEDKFSTSNVSNRRFGTEADPNFGPDFVYDDTNYEAIFNFVTLDVRVTNDLTFGRCRPWHSFFYFCLFNS